MRLVAGCPTKTDLESTFLELRIGWLRQNHFNWTLTKHFFWLVHNIFIARAPRRTWNLPVITSGNHTINHVRGTEKTIHKQPGTMFGRNIIKLLSLFAHKSSHVNWSSRFIQDPGCRRAVLKGIHRGRPSKQVSGLVRNQHQFCSCRIDLTSTKYFWGQRLVTAHIKARNMMPFRLKPKISVSPV